MPHSPPPILYSSPAGDIVLLDIPASLSAPPGRVPRCPRRPLAMPYVIAEPKVQTAFARDLSLVHDRLRPSLLAALEHLRQHYAGPTCLPRALPDDPDPDPPPGAELDFHTHSLLQLPSDAQEPLALHRDTTFSDISDILSLPILSSSPTWTALTLSYPHPPKIFHIPPRASFLLSRFQPSIATFKVLAEHLQRFHFILLDPPWPNRSAARSSTYSTLFSSRLLRLPVAAAMVPDGAGLVAIWITNRPAVRSFVLDTLFPRWGVSLVSEWIWLKIATTGDPMFALESSMRKPYEALLFARKSGCADMPSKTIVAVPDVHSRKPCVKGSHPPVLVVGV